MKKMTDSVERFLQIIDSVNIGEYCEGMRKKLERKMSKMRKKEEK